MDDNKGLKILSEVMGWNEEQPRLEFKWLKMMAAIKYDDYRDFLPGMRFLENLAAWLQQFDKEDRAEAYQLLRKKLIYISPPEMQRLVELFYHCVIERRLIQMVADKCNIPLYQVRVDPEAQSAFKKLRRRTLILGLSDGARIDILRHSTVGVLSNEQFVIQTQVDVGKWKSLARDLRSDLLGGADARFELVFLVDDFMGTGSSYLRFDNEENAWTGKLCKFLLSLESAKSAGVEVLAPDWTLCVHHYLATDQAVKSTPENEANAIKQGGVSLAKASHYTYGARLQHGDVISRSNPEDAALVALADRYYSTKIQTKHTLVGGSSKIALGYGQCGLPLVLHHNTPNNSLPLLWADVSAGNDKINGEPQCEMRPLFRRRQRHGEEA